MATIRGRGRVFRLFILIFYHYVVLLSCIAEADAQTQNDTNAPMEDKDSENALLKSNIYQDQKTLELYRYIDAQLNSINNRLAAQDVRNQGVADAIREVSKDIDYKVNLEAERRCCADQRVVAYANGTFATKLIADYTAGTTTTAMETFNPLCCECAK